MMDTRHAGRTALPCALVFAVSFWLAALPGAVADALNPHILGVHLTHPSVSAETANSSGIPLGYMIASTEDARNENYLVKAQPVLTDMDFAHVAAGFDDRTNEPVINFRLTPQATKTFAEATKANIGRELVIIIDGTVVSAPVISSQITRGAGVIWGGFTLDRVKDIVARMRAARSG